MTVLQRIGAWLAAALGVLLAIAGAIFGIDQWRKRKNAEDELVKSAEDLAKREKAQAAADVRHAADDAVEKVKAFDAAKDAEAKDAAADHDLVDTLRGWKRPGSK